MKPPFFHIRSRKGAALVVILLIVALITTILVAYMQLVDSEKGSSLAVSNRYRATLAAQAGLADFMAKLNSVVETGDFTVVEATENFDPNNPDDLQNKRYTSFVKFNADGKPFCIPLASYAPPLPNSPAGAEIPIAEAPYDIPSIFKTIDAVIGSGEKTQNLVEKFRKYGERDPDNNDLESAYAIEYPALEPENLVLNAQFVPVFKDADAEFAYVAVDESAKLNISLFGSEYKGEARIQEEVEDFSKEVAVAGSGNHSVSQKQLEEFQGLDPGLKAGPVWQSLFPTPIERYLKKQFYSSHKAQLVDYIPYGYLTDNRTEWSPFIDGGKPKYDLNKLATEKPNPTDNANEIADIISRNLVSFYKRDPSFENEAKSNADVGNPKNPKEPKMFYIKRLAASIVDYIDEDSVPTSVTDDPIAGKEIVPYPMQVAEKYYVSSVETTVGSNKYNILHTLYVQVWNPYSIELSGSLKFELDTYRKIKGDGPDDDEVPIPKLIGDVNILSLQPNEIAVYKIAEQSIDVNASSSSIIELPETKAGVFNKPQHSSFRAYFNNNLIDQTALYNKILFSETSGLVKAYTTLSVNNNAANPRWSCNLAQTVSASGGYRALGDPRQNSINNYIWNAGSYFPGGSKQLRWKGASSYEANSQNTQKFEITWKNRDILRRPLHIGNAPTSLGSEPTSVSSTYNFEKDSKNAPYYIANSNMKSVVELGNIYDPSHLNDSGVNTKTTQDPSSHYAFGGARTLRIGQPEFNYPTYAVAGQRAVNLLDLLSVNSTSQNHQKNCFININTSPREVLASFFYNLSQSSDKGVNESGKTYGISLKGANEIAKGIVAKRPYFSISEVWRFADTLINPQNYEPVFPKINPEIPPGSSETLDVLDRGREDIFRRAYNYINTKSGAFKFYGIGRALTSKGKITSEVAIEAQIEVKVKTDKDGKQTLHPMIVWQKKL